MTDSRSLSIEQLEAFRKYQSDVFRKNKISYLQMGNSAPKILEHFDRIIKIAEYSSRLSNEEYLQALMTVEHLRETLQYSVDYFIDRKFSHSFLSYNFVFDGKLPNKLSKMEKYLTENLVAFLHGSSINGTWEPLALPDIWKPSHPFIDNFMPEPGYVDINAIFKQGLKFIDSRDEPGLQLADMVCNTVYSYLCDPDNDILFSCYNTLKPAIAHKGEEFILGILLG